MNMNETYAISGHFNDESWIESRIAMIADQSERQATRRAMRYLYVDDGPTNCARHIKKLALIHLLPAEQEALRWVFTRTNGSLRSAYGKEALKQARLARFRCEDCGIDDVRVLALHHVNGRTDKMHYACLCQNCHAIRHWVPVPA